MNDFHESGISGYEEEFLDHSDRRYLNKFWLDAEILSKKWADVLDRSFVVRDNDVSISPTKEVDIRVGGLLFTEEEFNEFRDRSLQSGAKNFAVIEDVGQQDWKHLASRSFFRFSYPLSIAWGEVARSCAIADDIFLRPIRAYFVVTDNGRLGKYANNDAARPYDLVFIENPNRVRGAD